MQSAVWYMLPSSPHQLQPMPLPQKPLPPPPLPPPLNPWSEIPDQCRPHAHTHTHILFPSGAPLLLLLRIFSLFRALSECTQNRVSPSSPRKVLRKSSLSLFRVIPSSSPSSLGLVLTSPCFIAEALRHSTQTLSHSVLPPN